MHPAVSAILYVLFRSAETRPLAALPDLSSLIFPHELRAARPASAKHRDIKFFPLTQRAAAAKAAGGARPARAPQERAGESDLLRAPEAERTKPLRARTLFL